MSEPRNDRCSTLIISALHGVCVLRYFTWDKHTFPDPIAMQENLAASGRKLVTIVDPHIKRDPSYYIYKEAQDKGLYVLNKDKNEFDG